ncbi:unnamed protein product [Blepharisma stoltei]|uniref:DNA/RNA helicase protein n=1 Tax=Blepharisma stoltei TaxID=1481888 RepID=A0AAU9JXM8_9CILI|nr:unnamed protein product [Blepharisma stoltei]
METEKLRLFKEITGEQDQDKALHYLSKSSSNLDHAIDLYFQDIHTQNLTRELLLKRKIQASNPIITLGMFESDAYAISTVSHIEIGHPLTFKFPKPRPHPKGKRKETPDRTIRFAMEPNGFSFGKLPQNTADFLFPLISGNLITIEANIIDAPTSITLLDTFKIAITVNLLPDALSDPSVQTSEEINNHNISPEEYFNQREALQKLFELVRLEKTQSAIIDDQEQTNEKQSQEEGKSLASIEKNLFLENLGEIELREMSPPFTFRTPLYPYQKQALSWMYERESIRGGNRNSRELHHLWEEYKTAQGRFLYFNPYTGQISIKFPESAALCKGGILADEMGLGKTVMIIALIHTHRRAFEHAPKKPKTLEGGTLIVLPLSLITQWHQEINSHGVDLKVLEYYSDKNKSVQELKNAEIVLTTYGIINSEYANQGSLFKIPWFRVILDEAHIIRNKDTSTTKAVMKLQAKFKWALTGTPIQNKLDDLYSLVRFLEVEPWSDYLWWNRIITKPFNKQDPNVYAILRRLLKPIMLRRTKETKLADGSLMVSLPPISIETIHIEMNSEERSLYNRLFEHSKARLHSLISTGKFKAYIASIFDLLLRLRQLCDHPYLIMSRGDTTPLEKIDQFITKLTENSSDQYAQDLAGKIKQGEIFICPICLDVADDPVMTKCIHIMCRMCASQQVERNKNCPLCKTPLTMHDLTTVPRESKFSLNLDNEWCSSSKIDMLIRMLMISSEPTVVFTQWTSMLDLLEIALQKARISYSRLDGSMNKNQRENALQEFKAGRQVMLISLKAGGVGINLTYASRVVLMDPWWNPAVENQAIERVHRIGQEKQVKAYKFVCRDTVEEKMLALQERKNVIMEGAYTEQNASMSMENLMYVFQDNIM